MAYEHREGSGTLFQNDKKGNQKAPDYRGEVMIAGSLYELAGWKKLTSKGDTMLSISAKAKGQEYVKKDTPIEQGVKPAINNNYGSSGMGDFDNDLPFLYVGACGLWRSM